MTTDNLTDALFNAIEAAEFEGNPYRDIGNATVAVLAWSISEMPVNEREAVLADIEHDLRRAVRLFEPSGSRTPYPKAVNGSGHAH
jgi:hypothetical protein